MIAGVCCVMRRSYPCLYVRGSQGQPLHGHNNLEKIVKAKQKALEAELSQTSGGQLEARLTSVQPKSKPFLLLERLVSTRLKGFTAIILELDAETASDTLRCSEYVNWGADAIAIAVNMNAIAVPHINQLSAALSVPVMGADWIIHPLQVAQTAEAGASAVRLVYAVLKKGTAAILRYTQALGLDAIVEVVNLKELEEVATLGVATYGINLSVGLSLPIPGFRQNIAKSLLGNMPFGCYSIVGVSSAEEALEMRVAGADAVYIKQEVLERYEESGNSQETFLQNLRESLTGDD